MGMTNTPEDILPYITSNIIRLPPRKVKKGNMKI